MRKFSALEKKLKIFVTPKMLFKGKLVTPREDGDGSGTGGQA